MTAPRNRVFIAPAEIAGFSPALASGFEALGWEATVFTLHANRNAYKPQGRRSRFLQCLHAGTARLISLERWPGVKWLLWPLMLVLRLLVFCWALCCCRAYIFVFGQSLLPCCLDLWVFQKLGRPVVHVFLGSDSRAPFLAGTWLQTLSAFDVSRHVELTAREVSRKSAQLRRIHRYSTAVVDNPLSGILQPGRYINWYQMGFPTLVAEAAVRDRAEHDAVPIVLHAPSNPQVKGTKIIEQVVAELQAEGMAFEYRTLTGLPNAEVIAELDRATIVVDQVYSDTPLAGLASEGAMRGCAVIVGGYGWDALHRVMSAEILPPSICVTRETLKQRLKEHLEDPAACQAAGQQLKAFMDSHWTAPAVAARYLRLLEQDIPEEWWIDPDAATYVEGMGAEPEQFAPLIQAMVAEKGVESLGLPEGSSIRQRIRNRYLGSKGDHEGSPST